jgi:hypothetical protein
MRRLLRHECTIALVILLLSVAAALAIDTAVRGGPAWHERATVLAAGQTLRPEAFQCREAPGRRDEWLLGSPLPGGAGLAAKTASSAQRH